MGKLIDELIRLADSNEYPLHMPGHKRHGEGSFLENAYRIDVTEIEGYDNLYEAEGILKTAMDRAARVFGADRTWFLVNGSTVGILTAVSALTHYGDKILMARNCHRCVYGAVAVRGLKPTYLYPGKLSEWDFAGAVSPREVEEALEGEHTYAAIVITSPTYEGILSDIPTIAELAHARKIPLIVDEAHGAHFSLDERVPESAIHGGADVVIQSLHKTMPSFTQTALLHCKSGLIDEERIARYLRIYQTSSPSYILMSGIDECIDTMEHEGKELFTSFLKRRAVLLEQCKTLEKIRIFSEENTDPCKLVISVKNTDMTGKELQMYLLTKYHLQVEMAAPTYVIAILTTADTQDGFDRLYQALYEIDQGLTVVKEVTVTGSCLAKQRYTIAAMDDIPAKQIKLGKAQGCVAAEFVNIYPPGIPILVPGEEITEDMIMLLENYLENGMHVQGITEGRIEAANVT